MPTPSELQTCIDALSTACDSIVFPLLAAQTSDAGTGISFTVNTVADLPDLSTKCIGPGQIVFVKSIGVPVISTLNEWEGLDGSVLRRDYTARKAYTWGNVTGYTTPTIDPSASTNWCAISRKGTHTLGLKTDGTVWAWGINSYGQLGNNSVIFAVTPVQEVTKSTNWCQISTACVHSIAINTGGCLFTWGGGNCGRLGNNSTSNFSSPIREISSSTNWCQASGGCIHTVAIKTDGSLWAWGGGNCGQLGNFSILSRSSPVRETTSSALWCQASAGQLNSSAVTKCGQLYSWGDGSCGQIGVGTGNPACTPTRELTGSNNWCQVSFGCQTVGGVQKDGTLWMWGSSNCGMTAQNCGAGTTNTPAREVSSSTNWCRVEVGQFTVIALKTDSTLWTWGGGYSNGTGINFPRSSPGPSVGGGWCVICAGLGGPMTGIALE